VKIQDAMKFLRATTAAIPLVLAAGAPFLQSENPVGEKRGLSDSLALTNVNEGTVSEKRRTASCIRIDI
jgi:hypothetical protein